MNQPVILFDGVCNLCNRFVQFVINKDKKNKFRFASLQSNFAKERLKNTAINNGELNTVVLILDGTIYTKSTAALKIAKELGGLFSIFSLFIILPKFLRNAIYNWIAQNRYKWFGKQESCMLPTSELKSRFLD